MGNLIIHQTFDSTVIFGPPSFGNHLPPNSHFRVGIDVARVSAMTDSLRAFGRRFTGRLFTPAELAYAGSGTGLEAERLAARFAAKEALIKALGLSEAGVNWRDIEVVKRPDGGCGLSLHGRAANLAAALGVHELCLSLSHDGDYAGAIVGATLIPAALKTNFCETPS